MLVTGPAEQVGPAATAHRDQLRELREAGRLRIAGELADGDGFLDIFEAVDRMEAEAICRSNPLIEQGLVSWMLREWSEL